MNLILSADDFGKSKIANKNILALVDKKLLERVSIFANGTFSKEEIKKLLESDVKLDIHLELQWDHGARKGLLVRSLLFIWRIIARKTSARKVEKDWNQQINKFKKIFGKNPDGLNSHEHVHFFPPYFKIALELCKKYKIPYVRFGEKGILDNNSGVGIVLRIFNKLNKGLFLNYKLYVTSYMFIVSLDWIKDFKMFFEDTSDGTVEIVCHPEREEEREKILSNVVIR